MTDGLPGRASRRNSAYQSLSVVPLARHCVGVGTAVGVAGNGGAWITGGAVCSKENLFMQQQHRLHAVPGKAAALALDGLPACSLQLAACKPAVAASRMASECRAHGCISTTPHSHTLPSPMSGFLSPPPPPPQKKTMIKAQKGARLTRHRDLLATARPMSRPLSSSRTNHGVPLSNCKYQ